MGFLEDAVLGITIKDEAVHGTRDLLLGLGLLNCELVRGSIGEDAKGISIQEVLRVVLEASAGLQLVDDTIEPLVAHFLNFFARDENLGGDVVAVGSIHSGKRGHGFGRRGEGCLSVVCKEQLKVLLKVWRVLGEEEKVV